MGEIGTRSDRILRDDVETGYAKVPVPDISQALTWALGFLLAFTASSQAVQIGDLVRIKGSETSKLVGMGLVVGLNGTGDGGKFVPAIDSLAKAMRHLINESTVKEELKDSKNVALVYLEATTPTSGVQEGDRIDVHVSSLGAAKSLQGGRLLLMPMTGPLPDSLVYAYAFGQVTIENEDTPTTGVIRAGAQIALEIRSQAINDGRLTLVIRGANAHAGLRFHQNLVPARGELADALRRKADPELIVLDLFWNADLHAHDSRRVRLPEFRGYRI